MRTTTNKLGVFSTQEMKRLISAIVALFLILFGTVGCNEEMQVPELSSDLISDSNNDELFAKKLANDPRFIRSFTAHLEFQSRLLEYIDIYDKEKFEKQVMELENLIYQGGFYQFSRILGFSREEDLFELNKTLVSNYQELIEYYPQLQNNANLKNILLNAGIFFLEETSSSINFRTVFDCWSIYENCRKQANSMLFYMTVGCIGSVFIPGAGLVIGPLCELAAVKHHHDVVIGCGLAYFDCEEAKK